MNVLHYTLGLPPYRTGGLTKYSFDLMTEESNIGDNIYLLFPGRIRVNDEVNIKYYKTIKNIESYEVINPLPVSLLNGVCDPIIYMKKTNKEYFKKFFISKKIDVIHIHSFMGLYKELLVAAKELNIKLFYTTHDYYGLCTKVNLLDNNHNICQSIEVKNCVECNKDGYSIKKIKLLQSGLYRFLKNIGIVTILKKMIYIFNIKKNQAKKSDGFSRVINENLYNNLLEYYKSMFRYIDVYLFNSSISREIYTKYLGNVNGYIVPITHLNIKDNRKLKKFNNYKLRVTYLGPDKCYKGYDLLLKSIEKLDSYYKDKIEVNLYGKMRCENFGEIIKKNGEYSYSDLENIFDNTDLLVVPSIWYETFGFTVLEGISYGVPVLTTKNVGSKDLLNNNRGIIIEPNEKVLVNTLEHLIDNRQVLEEINKNILRGDYIFDMADHGKYIHQQYINCLEW